MTYSTHPSRSVASAVERDVGDDYVLPPKRNQYALELCFAQKNAGPIKMQEQKQLVSKKAWDDDFG